MKYGQSSYYLAAAYLRTYLCIGQAKSLSLYNLPWPSEKPRGAKPPDNMKYGQSSYYLAAAYLRTYLCIGQAKSLSLYNLPWPSEKPRGAKPPENKKVRYSILLSGRSLC